MTRQAASLLTRTGFGSLPGSPGSAPGGNEKSRLRADTSRRHCWQVCFQTGSPLSLEDRTLSLKKRHENSE